MGRLRNAFCDEVSRIRRAGVAADPRRDYLQISSVQVPSLLSAHSRASLETVQVLGIVRVHAVNGHSGWAMAFEPTMTSESAETYGLTAGGAGANSSVSGATTATLSMKRTA